MRSKVIAVAVMIAGLLGGNCWSNGSLGVIDLSGPA
jgi:hypothetical protein